MADPEQSLDSEQISPATIAHHTVYEKTPNLQQAMYVNGEHSRTKCVRYLVSWANLIFRHHYERMFLPLTKAANGPNSGISLTQTFDRILFYLCNSLYFGVQKAKKRGSGNNRVYRNLKFCVRQSRENIRLDPYHKRISPSALRTRGHSSKRPPFLLRAFSHGFPPTPGHGTPVIFLFAKKAPDRNLFRRCLTCK